MVSLGKCQCSLAIAVTDVILPQSPERTQSKLGVVKSLSNLKNICPGRSSLDTRAFGIEQRYGKRRV